MSKKDLRTLYPIPWEYFESASDVGIDNFFHSRLDAVNKHRECIEAEITQLLSAMIQAEVANLFRRDGERLLRILGLRQRSLDFSQSEIAIQKPAEVAGVRRVFRPQSALADPDCLGLKRTG